MAAVNDSVATAAIKMLAEETAKQVERSDFIVEPSDFVVEPSDFLWNDLALLSVERDHGTMWP